MRVPIEQPEVGNNRLILNLRERLKLLFLLLEIVVMAYSIQHFFSFIEAHCNTELRGDLLELVE